VKKSRVLVPLTVLSLVAGLSAPAYAEHGDRGNHNGWYKHQRGDEQQQYGEQQQYNVQQQSYNVSFDDIGQNFQWAQEAINKLTGEGIFRGMGQNHFQPEGKLNRAQFAAIISRYFSLQPANSNQQDFQDVQVGDWDYNVIEASKDYMTAFANMNGGYDFRPNQAINRAEAAVSLVELLIKQNAVQLVTADQANQILSVYSDADLIPAQLRIHVATAIQAGVIKGVGTDRFDPLSTLNRAQAATLLYRLQTQLEVPPGGTINSGVSVTPANPTEVVPGTPGSTVGSTAQTVTIGNPVSVNSNQFSTVYLVSNSSTAPTSVAALNSLVSSNLGSEAVVTQADSTVSLNTNNLAAGSYSIYGVNLNGNVTLINNSVQLVAAGQAVTPAISSVVAQTRTTDTTGGIQFTVGINTSNVVNNTPAVVTLVNENGTSLTQSITAQTTINNNTGAVTLYVPASLSNGTYKVLVTVGSVSDQSLTFTK
jgi:hypothetical protein